MKKITKEQVEVLKKNIDKMFNQMNNLFFFCLQTKLGVF